MKNHSRVLSWRSLENIDLLKLASEASQENFEKTVFLTTKYEQIMKLEHLLCQKVGGGGGGGTNPLVPPPLLKVGRHVPPLPPLLLRPCVTSRMQISIAASFLRMHPTHPRQTNKTEHSKNVLPQTLLLHLDVST